jgi:hypothetical protein
MRPAQGWPGSLSAQPPASSLLGSQQQACLPFADYLSWRARRRYRREVTSTVNALLMDEREWPALDKVIELGRKEQWGTDETAVLYAGKLLANQIEAVPDGERRQRIRRNVREWLALPTADQFSDLMAVAKAIISKEKSFEEDELLEWHIRWALDFVRRLQVTNTIDQATQDQFRETVWKSLFPDFIGRKQQVPETAYQSRSSN